ncbi:TIGR00266 family protein [Stieleria sp. TO1_6]|uniref:TIGR00266 family protein n=1 Tax=Stieleria tagensis TaxID=2956795 RepID=UPI00209A7ACF|nr:TIGR00266 family protein [Stieleria tagensis]MCO8121792.1 TIGR00266 family protein [Stieleria tagensis]
MEFRVNHAPVFSTLEFTLAQHEFVVAQPNSMLTMSNGIGVSAYVGRQPTAPCDDGERSIATAAQSSADNPPSSTPSDDASPAISPRPGRRNSWFSGFKNMLGGESFFTAEFRAKSNDQTVVLAPESYGDIVTLDLSSQSSYYLTRGSYLANVGATNIRIKYGGLKGLMSKKGLFLLHATGQGHVFCQSYGAIVHRYLEADETLFVDNRFMIAFSDTVTYQLVKATESIKDSLMSGEGLVNRYTGPGDLFFQTRGKPTGGFLTTLIDVAF